MGESEKMSEERSNITKEWELYMYLLRCAIKEEQLEEQTLAKYQDIESKQIRERAKRNGQLFLLDANIYEYAVYRKEENIAQKMGINKVIYEYEKYKCIRNVLALAKENKLPFVIFKGCVLADLYPQYVQRSSCDTDIFVNYEYREKAIEVLVNAGYVINEEHSKNEVCVLQYSKFPHAIELHSCLWEDYEGKRLDILKSFGLTDTDKLIKLETCGFEVTTLGYEEHLIYQLFHIIKHFSLEGVGMKYLADITLYVDAYGKYIDYQRMWKRLEELDYAKFAHYLFAICIEFLGMDRVILENRKMSMGNEFYEFMIDLFNGGVMYEDKSDSWQILGMMTPYFTGEKGSSKGKIGRKLAVIFPRAKDIQEYYPYLKKCPFLLPVAWVQKAVKYLINYRTKSNNWYSASEKLNVAEHRIDLMDKLGLLG